MNVAYWMVNRVEEEL